MAGSVRRRGDAYQVLLSYTHPDTGKVVQLSETVQTLNEVESAKARLILKRDAKTIVRDGNQTFADLAGEWMAILEQEGDLAAATLDGYRRSIAVNGRLLTAVGGVKCRDLTQRHIDLYAASLGHLAANTRIQEIIVVGAILKLGVKWGWVAKNYAKDVRRPTPPPTAINLPDDDGRARLFEAAELDGPWSVALVRVAIATGMRHGELAGLQWGDVEWDLHTVHVRRQVTSKGVVAGVKGSKRGEWKTRSMSVGMDTVAALKLYRDERVLEYRERWGREIQPTDRIFTPTPLSTPMSAYSKIGHRWQIIRASAALPTMKLHDCRHLNATRLLEAGVAVKAVSERLGHANPNITLAVYAQHMPQADETAGEIMDELFR